MWVHVVAQLLPQGPKSMFLEKKLFDPYFGFWAALFEIFFQEMLILFEANSTTCQIFSGF